METVGIANVLVVATKDGELCLPAKNLPWGRAYAVSSRARICGFLGKKIGRVRYIDLDGEKHLNVVSGHRNVVVVVHFYDTVLRQDGGADLVELVDHYSTEPQDHRGEQVDADGGQADQACQTACCPPRPPPACRVNYGV